MTNKEKMIKRIIETVEKLNEEYVRDVMICADTLFDIQKKQ